jgi:ribosomal protein S19E (S16A)
LVTKPKQEFYLKRAISLTLNDVANKQVTLEDLRSLYVYAKEQSKFWSNASEKYQNPNNHPYLNSSNYFNQAVEHELLI